MSGLDVGDLRPSEHAEAVEVLARGMRDNPIHVAAFGPDPAGRERALRRLFTGLFAHMGPNEAIAARRDGAIVAVTGVLVEGACRPRPAQAMRMFPAVAALGPRAATRNARWVGVWRKHDPDEAHDHLGPLAVDAHLQGR